MKPSPSVSVSAIHQGWGSVVPFASPNQRFLVSEPRWAGYDAVLQKLEGLIQLPVGWNGYNAGPVSLAAAYFALEMLKTVCTSATISPQIVPGPNGDLQVEWHTTRGSMELHVRAPNNVHAWRETATGEETEAELTTDFTLVAHWIKEFSELSGAVDSAVA